MLRSGKNTLNLLEMIKNFAKNGARFMKRFMEIFVHQQWSKIQVLRISTLLV